MLIIPSLVDYSYSNPVDVKHFLFFKVLNMARKHVSNSRLSVKHLWSSLPIVALGNPLSLIFFFVFLSTFNKSGEVHFLQISVSVEIVCFISPQVSCVAVIPYFRKFGNNRFNFRVRLCEC